jgi:hypothetical protein
MQEMKTENNYEQKSDVSRNAIQFAIACADSNTINELTNSEYADQSDCATWSITSDEWKWAVGVALYAKTHDGSIMDDGRVIV